MPKLNPWGEKDLAGDPASTLWCRQWCGRDGSSTRGGCSKTLPIQPPQYRELCFENSGLEWEQKLGTTLSQEERLLSPFLEETMLSASARVFAKAIDTWVRLMSDGEQLVSTGTLGQQQRQWKLQLADQVARSDCQYLSLEQGKFACWWLDHPKGLAPVRYRHYLHWLHLNPFWPHLPSKRQWRWPFWTTTRIGCWITRQTPPCRWRRGRSCS